MTRMNGGYKIGLAAVSDAAVGAPLFLLWRLDCSSRWKCFSSIVETCASKPPDAIAVCSLDLI